MMQEIVQKFFFFFRGIDPVYHEAAMAFPNQIFNAGLDLPFAEENLHQGPKSQWAAILFEEAADVPIQATASANIQEYHGVSSEIPQVTVDNLHALQDPFFL